MIKRKTKKRNYPPGPRLQRHQQLPHGGGVRAGAHLHLRKLHMLLPHLAQPDPALRLRSASLRRNVWKEATSTPLWDNRLRTVENREQSVHFRKPSVYSDEVVTEYAL